MGFLGKLFRRGPSDTAAAPEHAVIVDFAYGSTDLGPLFRLEDALQAAIQKSGAGEFDGNEVASDGSEGTLYMYGPNADELFAAVEPVLASSPLMQGARATIRYGPPEDGVRQTVRTIGA